MGLNLRRKIALKQARFILIIALLLGVFSTGLQIYLDLQQVRKNTTEDIERIISLYRDTATQAVYNLNAFQANEVTSSLISYPTIYHAQLIDDFSETLAEHRRDQTLSSSFLSLPAQQLFDLNRYIEMELELASVNSGNERARLIVELDTIHVANSFSQRAINSLLLGLMHSVALAAIILLLIYRYLSRPIVQTAKWVNELRSEGKSSALPYTAEDELGDLVRSFSGLWKDREAATDKLTKMVAELSESEHFSRSIMDNAGDAMFLCELDSTIFRVNNQGASTLGLSKQQLRDTKLAEYSKNYSFDEYLQLCEGISDTQVTTFEDLQINANGKVFPVEARAIKLSLQSDEYLLIVARDISVRKQAEKQIHELAFYDTLTGLPNRRLYLDRLTASLELHQANHSFGAVLFLDLDRFKTINDSLGHGVGDELLNNIAQRLTHVLPIESTCARFGGDEFVILLPETGSSSDVCADVSAHVAQEVLKVMSEPFSIEGHTLYCTASLGIAVFPASDASAQDIIRQADTALYRVKAMGRNGFQFYDPEMQSTAQERLEVEKGLHQALKSNQFVLWFQPQICKDGQIIGAEALIRWQHPEKGLIFPGGFIQVAEESGQIVEIGNWVLREGLKHLAKWRADGLPESFQRLAINISPMQFMQVDFVDQVISLMAEFDLPGDAVELEITENMLLNNFEVASHKMKLLKGKGVCFAIDDFGTGYSSLKYLRNLPLDILKIDRSFVTGLRSKSEEAAIVEVIMATADRLGLLVIAEGVETLEEKETLVELGCDCFQGYLLSKPLPADKFIEFSSANSSAEID
ncbi:putative bifunctional diguanylate cyclase/phosphodiesterase [Neptuniibacter sp. QD48_55]|uniref:putative bifunctional diguanylate cyclase/phosphodiesterase n=1 Tax=Neptuniibacter sp. QD48_55 TaxID=3398212 RepID=UPI0039F54388